MSQEVYAVVTAAGSGTRLGYEKPKALVEIAGKTIVERAVETLLAIPDVKTIVVTAPAEPAVLTQFQQIFNRHAQVEVVAGGDTRQKSVHAGLRVISKLLEKIASSGCESNGNLESATSPVVLIHDAARCLTPKTVIASLLEKINAGEKAAIPAIPVVDTLTQFATSAAQTHYVTKYADRSSLKAVQTPQAFVFDTIWVAHEKAAQELEEFTDDASLMRLVGESVAVVAGSEFSLKITTPFDLRIAEMLVKER